MDDEPDQMSVPDDKNIEDVPAEEQRGSHDSEVGEPFKPSDEDLEKDPA